MITAFVVSGINLLRLPFLPAPCPAEHIFRRRIIIDDFAGLRVLQHVWLAERHIVFGTVRNAEAQIALDDVPVVAPARQQIFQADAVERSPPAD